jgi:hypothetical protein
MAMQATRAHETSNAPGATSATFVAEAPHDPVAEAHRLACEVERLLTPATEAALASEAYGHKIARAMARSLIDQLSELAREPKRNKLA